MSIIRGVVLSDIHFGIKNSQKLFDELNEVFIPYIESEEIDILHLNGDYFEKKINLNESAAKLALNFFDKIVDVCVKNNIKLRVLRGTLSHDNNQLDNFFHYYTRVGLDLDIIKKPKVVQEWDDVKILYVPEEYVDDTVEYYKEFKEENPDIMMGHGTWDFVAFDNQISESESHDKAAPIFMYDDWKDHIKFCIFGHIHTRQKYKKQIYYPGSFSRWAHGEEKPKGFISYTYDTETQEHEVEFVENNKASEYKSLSLSSLGDDINSLEIEEIIQLANSALGGSEKVRLELTGLSEDKLILVKKALAENDNVKIKVKLNKKDESVEDKYSEFAYIVERLYPPPQTVQMYIKQIEGLDIPLSEIQTIMLPAQSIE